MEVAAAVAGKGARRLQEENLASVLSMAGGKDARKRTVQRVQRVNLAFASLMVVDGAANMKVVQRVPREAVISANLMEVARDACIQIVAKVRREAHYFARATEEENAVQLKAARRASMVALSSASHMGAGSDAQCRDAPGVLGDGLTAVFVMVGASGANLLGAVRVHRGVPTSARLMAEASVAYGGNQDRALELALLLASAFQGARMDSASHTTLSWKTVESAVARRSVLSAQQDLS